MNLSSNIKRLRREADLTQEQLAEILGVSFQSVSKWERNDGMPDIMLLPSIAQFFNTTIDELMNMDEERQKQESKALEEKLFTMAFSGKEGLFFEELALLREHVKKYPLDWERQMQLSWYIFSYTYPGESENEIRVIKWETVEILQRVVDYCDDMNLKAKATDFLVCALSALGSETEIENKMSKLIDSLPPARYSREMIALQANKKGKQFAFEAAKAHIDVLNEVFILMEMYGSAEDKVRINETKTVLTNLMDLYDVAQ